MKIPSVLNDCTHNFENPTPTPEACQPTPTPIPQGVEVIRITQPPSPEIPDTEPEVEIISSDNPPVSKVYGVGANEVGQLGGGNESVSQDDLKIYKFHLKYYLQKLKVGMITH